MQIHNTNTNSQMRQQMGPKKNKYKTQIQSMNINCNNSCSGILFSHDSRSLIKAALNWFDLLQEMLLCQICLCLIVQSC